MKPITKTAACRQALDETSELQPFGRNQWVFSWLDHSVNAWRESHPRNFHAAQHARRVHLIERAMEILHPDLIDQHFREPGDLCGGKWQSYVQ